MSLISLTLFLPCYPSSVIAPAECACLSPFAMPYCPCLNIVPLPLLPLLLLLWLHHHIVPFLFEPLMLVDDALTSVLPLLLPVAAHVTVLCCDALQQLLLPCILLPFCSHMPSTAMMPSTATMLSEGIPELQVGHGGLHALSKRPTSIAAVQ